MRERSSGEIVSASGRKEHLVDANSSHETTTRNLVIDRDGHLLELIRPFLAFRVSANLSFFLQFTKHR